MSESKFEGNQPPEIPTQKEIFEHLFPGNSFEKLPRFDMRNLDAALEIMNGYISGLRSGRDSVNIIRAAEENGTFVLRQEFAHPDRIMASYHLAGLFPFGEASHPTMFQGNSFSDLVDTKKGEKLAGVGQRSIKWHAVDLFNLFSLNESNYPFINKKEIVLGVVNKEGKPNAIIHFVEGHMKRVPKRVEKASRVGLQKPGFVRERA